MEFSIKLNSKEMKILKYSWFFTLLDVSHGNLISYPQSSYLKQNDVSRVTFLWSEIVVETRRKNDSSGKPWFP